MTEIKNENASYDINYGNKVSVVPFAALDCIERASKNEIKVLVALSANGGSTLGLSEKLGIDEKLVDSALEFWSKNGIITPSAETVVTEATGQITVEKADSAIIGGKRPDSLPNYSSDEITRILEARKDTSAFMIECQNVFGKIFNSAELNVVIGMLDFLGLDYKYVLALLGYCARIDKRSMRYAEKLAVSLVDEGIDDSDKLLSHIEKLEKAHENETAVRKLFGMKSRALSAKEKKIIDTWFGAFGYDIAIVTKAYEITVDTKGEAIIAYAHAILSRWHDDGLKTLDEIENSIKQRAEKGNGAGGSFDTDDFFEAALKRSYDTQN